MSNHIATGEASDEPMHRTRVTGRLILGESSSEESPDGRGPGEEAQALLAASRGAARRGDVDNARRLLRAAVLEDPDCTEAWLQLAWLARNRRERSSLLRQVLALEPEHPLVQPELARFVPSRRHWIPGIRKEGGRMLGWALAVLALVAGVVGVTLLVWRPVDASASAPPAGSLEWLVNVAPLHLLSPATTGPPPASQPTPGQIAARFVPQLRAALSGENWGRALDIVAIMSSVDPSGDEVRQWAFTTSMQYGQDLVDTGQANEAQKQFEQAVTLAPDDAEARLWQQTTQFYLAGQEALEAGQWEAAAESFILAQDQMPGYADLPARLVEAHRRRGEEALEAENWSLAVKALTRAHEHTPDDPVVVDLLGAAHRQRGIDLQDRATRKKFQVGMKKLKQARADLEAALALRPDDAVAKTHLEQVIHILRPPKRIEVDISEQRLYAWQGDRLIYEFPVSTGLRGQDTATGTFQVLDKIPMAYSRIWKLKMPHWMGIYYVQGIENGFHALPIRPDGSRMWAGLLGRRASYGCIVLGIKAGKTLYNWAEIGTRVDIHG